jgi:hypothetical protein
MKTLNAVLIFLFVVAIICSGCSKRDGMHTSKKVNPQGLPIQGPQIGDDETGKPVITITPELTYPGMESYAGQNYEFVSKDDPQKVADWYQANLAGSTMQKTVTSEETDSFWTVNYKKLIIRIYYYNGNESIIKFKTEIK